MGGIRVSSFFGDEHIMGSYLSRLFPLLFALFLIKIKKNFENAKIDGAYSIDDQEALPILYDLIQNEGLSLGTSCGINIAGAIRLGKELGP